MRRSKYNNKRTVYDGKRFDSLMELRRWQQLEQLVAVGAIRDLRHHTRWKLEISGVNLGSYECDAEYWLDGYQVVEDTKGVRTAVYRLKAKLMRALHGVTIQEISR